MNGRPVSGRLKALLVYTGLVLAGSLAYFAYVRFAHPPSAERETWLSELGEGVGELALWCLVLIYGRTILKLVLGKGALARRLLPDYGPPGFVPGFPGLLGFLDAADLVTPVDKQVGRMGLSFDAHLAQGFPGALVEHIFLAVRPIKQRHVAIILQLEFAG